MPQNMEVGGLFTDKIDADKTIQKLVELEKSKSDQWENEKFLLEVRKKAWEGLQKKLKEIDTASKRFINPLQTPFKKMKTKSDKDSILTASAENKVTPGDYKFKVIQLATPDILRTDPLPRNTKIPELKFEILYKNKSYKCDFKGGSLDAFAKYLAQRVPDILNAYVIKVDEDSVILNIEGKETGENSQIIFKGNLEALENLGLLKKYTFADQDLQITDSKTTYSNKGIADIFKDGALRIFPLDEIEKAVTSPIKGGPKTFLRFKMKVQAHTPPETLLQRIQKIGIGIIDKVWVGEVEIEGESMLGDPDFAPKEKVEPKSKNVLTIVYDTNEENIDFPYNSENEEWQEISIELKENILRRIRLGNPFTDKEILVKEMKVVNENMKGYSAKNAIKKAGDSILEYKGVQIKRGTNKIDDVIPGMSLYLKGVSNEEANINVDWNYDEIKNNIVEFVVMYNNAMDYIKNITAIVPPKNQKEMTAWRKSFKDIPAKEAEEKAKDGNLFKGVLNGDLTASMIRSKLREVMVKPYPTSVPDKVRFNTQIGIENPKYTSGSSTDEERENMRAGYFEFNAEKFDKILKDYYQAVTDYFITDTNKDLIYDDGLAVKMTDTLKMVSSDSFRGNDGSVYTGMIRSRINMLDATIKLKQRDIERWAKHVEDYEAQIRSKFAKMYRSMQKSKAEEQRMKGFNKD